MPKDEWGNIVSENEYYSGDWYPAKDEFDNSIQTDEKGNVRNERNEENEN